MDNLVANNTVDITPENFQQVILVDSKEKIADTRQNRFRKSR